MVTYARSIGERSDGWAMPRIFAPGDQPLLCDTHLVTGSSCKGK